MFARSLGRADIVDRVESSPPTLEHLFRHHADEIFRLVQRLLGPGASRPDIEDLTQQIFLAAHRALPKFRGESKPSTWLWGIATRLVYRELRNRSRHRRMVASLEKMIELLPQTSSAHDRQLEQRQELARVWRCLLEISAKKRMVFVLHDLEGMSGREVADALEIKEATVHTRLHHARRELKAKLDEEAR